MKPQSILLTLALLPLAGLARADSCQLDEIRNHGQVTAECPDKFVVLKAIEDGSKVKVVAGGDIDVAGKIDGASTVVLRSETGSIAVRHGIAGASVVALTAENGSIAVGDGIAGASKVNLSAPQGSITVGQKIDGNSQVCLSAHGNITIEDKIERGDGRTEVWWEGAGFAVPHGNDGAIVHPHQACPWKEPAVLPDAPGGAGAAAKAP